MDCPYCGKRLEVVGKFAVCPDHGAMAGHTVKPEETIAKFSPSPLDAIPTVLALPLSEFEQEPNPVLALWHACDAVELALRFVVIAGLAELRCGGPLDPKVLAELRPRIEEPTLGKWRGMAQAVARHLPAEAALIPELRALVEETIIPLLDGEVRPRRAETSLSVLRNQLAHGGGITSAVAARLLECWRPRLEAFAGILAWTRDLDLVVQKPDGGLGVLRGARVTPAPYEPSLIAAPQIEDALKSGNEVLLVRGGYVLTLCPLTFFGTPRTGDPDAAPMEEIVPQIFARRGEIHLQFTPLGSDVCAISEGDEAGFEAFSYMFRLNESIGEESTKRFLIRGFEAELRKDAGKLVGRSDELDGIRGILAKHSNGILWLTGPAGIGKSYLLAVVITELLDNPPANTLVLPYRFRAGDARCSRDSFLAFALERLAAAQAVTGRNEKLEDEKQKPLDRLAAMLDSLDGARVLFVLDGLDELAERDPGFAHDVPLALAKPGVLWLCAGRPERELPRAFSPERCIHIFPEGVPPMGPGDVRTMLLEKIGNLRRRLVANDQDTDNRVTNAFVDKVAASAKGFPLYVTYVIGDILCNRIRALDAGERLPPSLERYHEELLRRCAVGILHQVVTPLVATLAVAYEPLSTEALADLLEHTNVLPREGEGIALVRRALGAVGAMIRRTTTPEGAEGYTLFHHSLRQHMEASEEMAPALATARTSICRLSATPGVVGPKLATYLYRHGVAHLHESGRRDDALVLLTDFAYLMRRLRHLGDHEAVIGVLADWRAVVPGALTEEQRLWAAFFQERAHLLRRGGEQWPTFKILLQLAIEHADDSAITRQAERWLAGGHCDWVWLRNLRRPPSVALSPCLAVFEGHTDIVKGAKVLPDGRILSWSEDGTLRLWEPDGQPGPVLEGHKSKIIGATDLSDGRILSWSGDGTLRLWEPDGRPGPVLEGHRDVIGGATVLPDGRILSWAWDGTLQLWDSDGTPGPELERYERLFGGVAVLPDGRILSWAWDGILRLWELDGAPGPELKGHTAHVYGITVLLDGRILSWAWDGTLRLWDSDGTPGLVIEGHTAYINGATVLPDGRILSWSDDDMLRLWHLDGTPGPVLEGHTLSVNGAAVLPDGRILSWSDDRTLRLWKQDGRPGSVLEGHSHSVNGATVLSDGRILSWAWDGTLRLWDPAATSGPVLERHAYPVKGIKVLPDGRILSWSGDGTLRLWEQDGRPGPVLEGHLDAIGGATVLPDGRILSWAWDGTLRLWDSDGRPGSVLEGHTDYINGAKVLPDGRILSWSKDETLRLWEPDGRPGPVLEGHRDAVGGATVLPDGRILSWALDGTLRLWDSDGSQGLVLEAHKSEVIGTKVLPDGRILSWSDDCTLRLWESDGRPGPVLEGHKSKIIGAKVLPDGRILSWSGDGTLRIWEPDGRPGPVLEGHKESVIGAAVLPDGRILSWAWDGTLRLWEPDGRSGTEATVADRKRLWNSLRRLMEPDRQGLSDRMLSRMVDRETTIDWLGVRWHSDNSVTCLVAHSDATPIVGLAIGNLFRLGLFRGARTISMEELLDS